MLPWCCWSLSSRVVDADLLSLFVLLWLSLFGLWLSLSLSLFEPDQGTVSAPPAKDAGTHMGPSVWKKGGRPRQSQLDIHGKETLKKVRTKSKDRFD